MNIEIEEFAEKFSSQIRRGFISALILLALERKSSHGYAIIKEIDLRTSGMWRPSASSIYPVLDSMQELRLVEYREEKESVKIKKIYSITPDGKIALKALMRKYNKLKRAIRSITFSTIGLNTDFELDEIEHIFPIDPIFGMEDKTKEEKIQTLKFQKSLIKIQIEDYQEVINNIDKRLMTFKEELETIT